MTNESYWEYHEMKEAISGTDEHFCSYKGYKRDDYPEAFLDTERVLARHSYNIGIFFLDLLYKEYGPIYMHVLYKYEDKEND
ncbi:MAG: hypothetical protein ACLT3T_13290 [Holdemanella porci]